MGSRWRQKLVLRVVLLRTLAPTLAVLLVSTGLAHAQLRIVSYNLTTGDPTGVQTPRAGTDIVLRSIGEELRNGIAKPIDVLLLQEQYTMAISTQAVVDLLNGIYGPGTYARGFVNGSTSSPTAEGGRPGIVYNTQTVQLIEERAFGPVSGSAQARSTLRYQLRPVGYDSTADFYAYNSHYKAGATGTDENRRNIEASSIRNNSLYGSNSLGPGAHVIYAGDHNFYRSTEAAFQTLIAPGNGQAFDPIDRIGNWNNNASFADVHTQSTCVSSCGVFASGGVDDRFDFQLVTSAMLDGEGVDYIPGSYRAFGNNGVSFNQAINNAANLNVATGYPFTGVTSHTRTQILNALRAVTDHLPVVADYQVPAIMHAALGTVPTTLNVGDIFDIDVTVGNIANVVAAIGADLLTYSVTTAFGGDVSGSYFDQEAFALSGGNVHSLSLDTSTPGLKTGTIFVQSGRQGVQNALYQFPISYEVLAAAALYGDYNNDGIVDAADYTFWRNHLGSPGEMLANRDPNVEGEIGLVDYEVWQSNYGLSLSGSGGFAGLPANAVPEPATWLLLVLGGCLCRMRGGRLRAWNLAT